MMNKGQVTLTNLLAIVITIMLYTIMMPVIGPMIDAAATKMLLNPNDMTQPTIMVMYMMPFILILAIALTALNYAIPRREGQA